MKYALFENKGYPFIQRTNDNLQEVLSFLGKCKPTYTSYPVQKVGEYLIAVKGAKLWEIYYFTETEFKDTFKEDYV